MSINVFSIMVHYCQKNDRRTLFETIKDEKDPCTSSWWLRFINNSYIEFINNSTGSSRNYYTYCHVTYVTFVCSDKQTLSSMNDSSLYLRDRPSRFYMVSFACEFGIRKYSALATMTLLYWRLTGKIHRFHEKRVTIVFELDINEENITYL